jgi:hypothetical protein
MQIVHRFQADSWLGGFFSSHGMVGVNLFFTLSGFVMCKCIEKKTYYLLERNKSLLHLRLLIHRKLSV